MKGEHSPTPNQPSSQPELEPKIYVASLSDYNNGRLHGDWLDAARDADDLSQDIDGMLAKSTQPDAEEWAIHDYEGFGAFRLGEYENLGMVAMIGMGIAQHGRPFSHWANLVGTADGERLDRFEDHYRGNWNSMAAYAEDFLDDMGVSVESFTPGWLSCYVSIDFVALGNDLAADLETADDPDGTVHVFETEI